MQLGGAPLNGPCEEQNNVINLGAYEILVPIDIRGYFSKILKREF